MKIYAKQVEPAYQSAPQFFEHIILSNNLDIYEMVKRLGRIVKWYREDNFYYDDELGWLERDVPQSEINEALDWFSFWSRHDKHWTEDELQEWKTLATDIIQGKCNNDDDEVILACLKLFTGHEWVATTIHNQLNPDEFEDIYFDTHYLDDDDIGIFEIAYYDTGIEVKATLSATEETQYLYLYGYHCSYEQEIAEYFGCSVDDVILKYFDYDDDDGE